MSDATNGPSLLLISGTSRPDNYTHRALAVVADELTRLGLAHETFDARGKQLAFPGEPATADAEALQAMVDRAAGIVLATPEYHGCFAAMTKLIIENLGFPSALRGKVIALVGVAAGRIGAIKSLELLRGVLSHTGALVVPKAVSIAGVRGAFDGARCTDEQVEKALRGVAENLREFLRAYVCPTINLEEMARASGQPWPSTV